MIMSKRKFETLEFKIKNFVKSRWEAYYGQSTAGNGCSFDNQIIQKKNVCFFEKYLSFKIGTSSTIYEENWRM